MNYRHYTANDFALDKNFQEWVMNPGPETNRFWTEWINAHPEKKEEVAEAIKLVHVAGLSDDHQANTEFLTIWNQLHVHAQQTGKSRRLQVVYRYAAILIGFLLLASYLLWNTAQTPEFTQYSTRYGETKEVMLPDGSTVTLNANSRLRLAGTDWAKNSTREVFLEGEAFFEVVKTKDRQRFIVKTAQDVNVQVLGTTFNVKARRENTQVYLQSGKVQVQSNTGEAMLNPGQLAKYSQNDKKLLINQSDSEAWLAWKDDLFVFDDVPLAEAAQTIEDYFGLNILIADRQLMQKRFTAKVPRSNADVLLNVISETLQIDIIRQANNVRMQPRDVQAH